MGAGGERSRPTSASNVRINYNLVHQSSFKYAYCAFLLPVKWEPKPRKGNARERSRHIFGALFTYALAKTGCMA